VCKYRGVCGVGGVCGAKRWACATCSLLPCKLAGGEAAKLVGRLQACGEVASLRRGCNEEGTKVRERSLRKLCGAVVREKINAVV